MTQLRLVDQRLASCPFGHRIDDTDSHCLYNAGDRDSYGVLAENSPDFALRLATTDGIDLEGVVARPTPLITLPRFIPSVPKGNGGLLNDMSPAFVAMRLSDVVSPKTLKVDLGAISRLGAPPSAKIILTSYGYDDPLERMWPVPVRRRIFRELKQCGFDIVTAVNYSVWDDQPHAERLWNEKRSLVTFKEMQDEGLPAIPHLYWCGQKDLEAWCIWLNNNPDVTCIAINLQTIGNELLWSNIVRDITYLDHKTSHRLTFVISGPGSPNRIRDVIQAARCVTIISSDPAQKALHRWQTTPEFKRTRNLDMAKPALMRSNSAILEREIRMNSLSGSTQHIRSEDPGGLASLRNSSAVS